MIGEWLMIPNYMQVLISLFLLKTKLIQYERIHFQRMKLHRSRFVLHFSRAGGEVQVLKT